MKHPDDDSNEDISKLHHTEILQGDVKNFRDKPIVAQEDTKRIKGMEAKIFSPP